MITDKQFIEDLKSVPDHVFLLEFAASSNGRQLEILRDIAVNTFGWSQDKFDKTYAAS